jgi:hypothetical protein
MAWFALPGALGVGAGLDSPDHVSMTFSGIDFAGIPRRRRSAGASSAWACTIATVLALLGCDRQTTPSPPRILVVKSVTVPPGGGAGGVVFDAFRGQTVRITMTSPATVEPYGFLERPDGTSEYFPRNESAKPGFNGGEMVLSVQGSHQLTVFDGSNRGGEVAVKIETQ